MMEEEKLIKPISSSLLFSEKHQGLFLLLSPGVLFIHPALGMVLTVQGVCLSWPDRVARDT
jgi:hypothetical protein